MASTSPVASAGAVATAELARRLPAARRRDLSGALAHAILIASVVLLAFPLYYAFVISTQTLDEVTTLPPKLVPSTHMLQNYADACARQDGPAPAEQRDRRARGRDRQDRDLASVRVAIVSSFPRQAGRLWMIFITLMLPVPVRIVSTYQVVSVLGWVDTYWGLTVPLLASATGTFPSASTIRPSRTLAEAAQLDGAGPLRFLWSFLLPLSKANIAALFVILFVYGWNDYLWPDRDEQPEMRTAVIGIDC
jgi:sn-glycerol 3-phosphate transport system permease protein